MHNRIWVSKLSLLRQVEERGNADPAVQRPHGLLLRRKEGHEMSKGHSGHFEKTTRCRKYESKAKDTERSLEKKSEEPNFYVGANGGVLPFELKKWIGVNRRERLLKKAKSKELKNAVEYLYRPGSFVGDGGTASALKFEGSTGLGIGKSGNTHLKKATDFIKHLEKLETDKSLSKGDRKLVREFKTKLLKAMREFEK